MSVEPRPIARRLRTKIEAPASLLADLTYPGLMDFPFNPADHWIWIGAYSKKKGAGYDRGPDRPVIQLGRRGTPVVPVLRVMLSLKDGVPLYRRDGLFACHTEACSLPACVNPFHGYWGTSGRNHQDRERSAPHTFLKRSHRQ